MQQVQKLHYGTNYLASGMSAEPTNMYVQSTCRHMNHLAYKKATAASSLHATHHKKHGAHHLLLPKHHSSRSQCHRQVSRAACQPDRSCAPRAHCMQSAWAHGAWTSCLMAAEDGHQCRQLLHACSLAAASASGLLDSLSPCGACCSR